MQSVAGAVSGTDAIILKADGVGAILLNVIGAHAIILRLELLAGSTAGAVCGDHAIILKADGVDAVILNALVADTIILTTRAPSGLDRQSRQWSDATFPHALFVACFLTSSTFSFHGVFVTAVHCNLNVITTFINGTSIISTFRQWDDADSYSFIDAAAATNSDQQTC